MSEVSIADRIKKAIIDNGGYQNISDVTGISKSTLARMAANQTEPKLKDVMAISKATGVSLNYIAYGMLTEDEEESALNEKKMFNLILNLVNHFSREVEELRAKVGVNDPKGNLNARRTIDGLSKDITDSVTDGADINNLSPEALGIDSKEHIELLFDLLNEESKRRNSNLDTMLEPTQPHKSKLNHKPLLEHAALELLRRIALFPFGALFLSHLSKSPI